MNAAVLDAFALLTLFQDEPGADVVQALLESAEQGGTRLYLSIINAGEVRYRLAKLGPPHAAAAFVADLRRHKFPVEVVAATNRRVWAASEVKAKYRLSYADAFAVALAREVSAPLVTGDPEIVPLSKDDYVAVEWLPFKGRAP